MWRNKVFPFFMNYKWVVGIFPALLYFILFFVGGFFQAFFISIDDDLTLSPKYVVGWAYVELMTVSFAKSLAITVGIALIVALVSGMIALIVSVWMAVQTGRRNLFHIVFQLPIGVPHLMAAYMLMQVFTQSGWYSKLAFKLGWIDSFEQFPVLVHDDFAIGVIVTYLWKEVPFLILLMYPFICKLFIEWKETAEGLGASTSQLLRWIIIPQLLPIWIGGMWVVFAFTLGAYEIPALVGQTSLGSVPVIAWQEYTQFGLERQKVAIAMNVVLASISFIVGCVLIALQRNLYEKGRRLW